MNITKTSVDKLTPPVSQVAGQTAQERHYDDKLKGFGVRITSGGTRAFFVEKKVNFKLRRITIGHYPELTVEQARREAQILLGSMARGVDPVAEKSEKKALAVTLNDVFESYLKARKGLKPGTVMDYRNILRQSFSDWLEKPLSRITKDMIAKRHTELGEKSEARANNAMRVLRALFNFAGGQYENAKGKSLFPDNPVKRLSHTRAWYKVDRRDTIISTHQLPAWYRAVKELAINDPSSTASTIRDYLLLILFTGLRRQEAAQLTWEQVDFKAKTFTIIDTKNNRNHTMPCSDYIYDLLKNRYEQRTQSPYVFAGTGKAGYIIEPRKQMKKVIEASGVEFCLHDLRRTFVTNAESLDIPAYALKRLLNHKSREDVTAGYIVMEVERLRKPMQEITDFILRTVGEKYNVVELVTTKGKN